MKIFYLSVTSFTDVDFKIMQCLSGNDITYGVIIQKRNANYNSQEIEGFCKENNVKFAPFIFNYQQKDPRSFVVFSRIIRTIKLAKPDIIYIASFDHIIFSILSLSLNPDITVIALHDVEFHVGTLFMKVLRLARKIVMGHFKHFQVFSNFQKARFEELYPDKKVYLIPLPLKDYGSAKRNGQKLQSDRVRFLFFGNIFPYKGLDLLLMAIDNLIRHNPELNFELLIAGRCDDWELRYETLIKNKSYFEKNIGFINNRDVEEIFETSHYLILPYREATQSGPLKIAFNYNIPVIASDIPSFKEEIQHEVNGYLFKVEDIKDIEQTLYMVLKKHEDNYAELKRMQKNYVDQMYSELNLNALLVEMFNDVLKTKYNHEHKKLFIGDKR